MGVYDISKDFTFSASHMLKGLPPEHQCARLHGHNYIVRVVLESQDLNKVGFVRDYGDLVEFKEYIDAHVDHRHLGWASLFMSVPTEEPQWDEEVARPVFNFNPTAENLAEHFYNILKAHLGFKEVVKVGVSETDKVWAWYDSEEIV